MMSGQAEARCVDLTKYRQLLPAIHTMQVQARVVQAVGLAIEAEGLSSETGEVCEIVVNHGRPSVLAEVVGFREGRSLLMPLGETTGIQAGSRVIATRQPFTVPVGEELLGRVMDGLGRPLDDRGPLPRCRAAVQAAPPPHPLRRTSITEPLVTGVRAIDGLLTVGKGQRVGIFAGSGVGKSSLLGMLARNTTGCGQEGAGDSRSVSVVALVGERGREVRDFIDHSLGPQGLARSVVVVSTSDLPALVRLKAGWTATTIAEWFRDQGYHVTLLMDSVTRLAMAQREVGLAVGEPPAMRAYPPSVFALMPRLMERAGTSERGSITAFYTVLVEGDDLNEPITDTARSILDGHIVLSRSLAAENHYPAIDVLASVSRLFSTLASPEHRRTAAALRETMATYERARDLINIGAYTRGSNPQIDRAIALLPQIRSFLRQRSDDVTGLDETLGVLELLAS
jgi:FliI/YscN family ATPase